MIQLLLNNPLLLLFVVAGIGYPLGRIKVRGTSLGVSAVLFVGLAVGALHPDLKLPEIVYQLGQVLFIYTIGLSTGSAFFNSFRRKGLRDNLLAAGVIALGALLTGLAHSLLHLKATFTAGLFAGSMTNTPALAALLEYIKAAVPANLQDALLSEPVIAYSLTYPAGVIATILVIYGFQRAWKVDYQREARELRDLGYAHEPLQNRTITVTRPEVTGLPIRELIPQHHWNILFGRNKHDGRLAITTGQTRLAVGDVVNLIGSQEDLDRTVPAIGEPASEHLEQDLSKFDKRRFFVSNPAVTGKRLRDLQLLERFGAIVTRIRRGDSELLPRADTLLAPGDQVRVVAEYAKMETLADLFGDSYRAISEIDILSFSLGIALGLLLGLVPIPLPGGLVIHLGTAGGPLIVALALGALGRTGPMVWTLPYSANLTLRQIGLVLFLAGIGTRSGYAFISTLKSGGGLLLLAAGVAITCIVTSTALVIGYRLLKIPMGLLIGMVAGMQTQTAVLGFALEQTGSDLPTIGYAAIYPMATVFKIVLAQVLLSIYL